MKKLNLSDLKNSEIKYEHRQYPDGQQDIIIDTSTYGLHVEIQSRMNSFLDLEKIICATKSLRRLGVITLNLYIPYLLGARSDRKFVAGGNSYLVDVIAPIINSLEFHIVTTIDVHSDVAAACINNLKIIDNLKLVDWAIESITSDIDYTIISPDAGSEKKIYPLLKKIKYPNELIIARKHREISSGNILSVDVDISHIDRDRSRELIIIDDICDGGRTFIELAKAIRSNPKVEATLYLVVTHGIFSNGFKELNKYFDGIYCTNSINNYGDYYSNGMEETNVKQLKVI